jgi:hypothetical protein
VGVEGTPENIHDVKEQNTDVSRKDKQIARALGAAMIIHMSDNNIPKS